MRIATAFSIFGFVTMLLRREPAAGFMIIVCVLYSPLYYIVVSDMRYRYPVLWISLLAAGYLIRLLEPSRAATTSGARR